MRVNSPTVKSSDQSSPWPDHPSELRQFGSFNQIVSQVFGSYMDHQQIIKVELPATIQLAMNYKRPPFPLVNMMCFYATIVYQANISILFTKLTHTKRVEERHMDTNPDSKVHGANMGLIWGRQVPDGPHVDPMNFAIWEHLAALLIISHKENNNLNHLWGTFRKLLGARTVGSP